MDYHLKEKHKQVRSWLENVLVDQHIPGYEIDERTLDILHGLAEKVGVNDRCTELLIADYRQKADEYRTTAQHNRDVLKRLGLTQENLSQSGVVSVRTLAAAAQCLDLKNTSITSFLLGLTDHSRQMMDSQQSMLNADKENRQLFYKTSAAQMDLTVLNRMLKVSEEEARTRGPALDQKKRQTPFLKNKGREYKEKYQQLKRQLAESGVDQALHHQTLVENAEKLSKMKEKLSEIQGLLKTYQSLPANLTMAKVKLQEAKLSLQTIEGELSHNIDLIKT